MTAVIIWAGALGLALGIGLCVAITGLPALNRPQMAERIAPYVMSVASPAAVPRGSVSSVHGAARILVPVVGRLTHLLERFTISTEQLNRRLLHAGLQLSTVEYRLQQILCAVAALAAAIVFNLVLLGMGRFSVVFAVVSLVSAGLIGALGRDYFLTRRIQQRRQSLLAEFPALADMLALAVGAGETALGALERVGRAGSGQFAQELTLVVQRTRAGDSLSDALEQMNRRTDIAPISRFLEGVMVAVQRGTPLAEVLRAQASDVRELAKRELMESAGKREIGMLVPLIFGVLPLTVVFAVYPGMELLSMGP